jgi:osmotically-inducible protein OsmY
MPPPVQVGFAVPRATQTPAASVAQVLTRTDRIQKLSPLEVTIDSGTAVLRGRVATDQDRALAGIIASMQPGVGDVRNELQVGAPGARITTGSAR